MSLRVKFYLSFCIMIVLAAFIGGMAIRAFLQTNRYVESTRAEVGMVSDVIAPATSLVTQIYTDINQASLFYHAYGSSRAAADLENGTLNVNQIRERIGKLDDHLGKPEAAILAEYRATLADARRDVDSMETQALRLADTFARANNLQARLGDSADAMTDQAGAMLADVVAALAAAGDDRADADDLAAAAVGLADFTRSLAEAGVRFWRGRDLTGEEALAAYGDARQAVAALADKTGRLAAQAGLPAAVAAGLDDLNRKLAAYGQGIADFAGLTAAAGDIGQSLATASESVLNAFDSLDEATGAQMLASTRQAHQSTVEIDRIVDSSTYTSLIILVAAVLAGVILALAMTKSVVGPIVRVITSLTTSEGVIGSAAAQIAQAASDLAEGVSEQAASLEETSSALEEVSSMTQTNAAHARTTSETIQRTAVLVSEGAEEMGNMSGAMSDINAKADQISNIIKTIEDIAFQTNLLALNAAVEAARAGEAGKGFAVVADEVRSLSGRSAQAAKDTADLINGTVDSVRAGSSILDRLSGGYGEIEKSVGEITRLINQIAVAVEEQATGTEQINNAVGQMDKITQQNAAGASESAASVQNLNDQIDDLRDNIVTLGAIIHGRKNGHNGNGNGSGHGPLLPPPPARAPLPAARQLTGPRLMRPDYIE